MKIDLSARVRLHAALGEEHRLAIVDALRLSDRTPSELQELTGQGSNLLAFHLDVLDGAGLVERRRSQGDARRRYVSLRWDALEMVDPSASIPDGLLLFVCSRNAARSQLAAAMWRGRTGRDAISAGAEPADEIDSHAQQVARQHGLQLDGTPRGYDAVEDEPALVVSVCDRAREAGVPWSVPQLHWSVRDPVGGDAADYEAAYTDLARRIERLAAASGRAT